MHRPLIPFNGLPSFTGDFGLQWNQLAALVARSPRTVRRWRRRGLVPLHALDLLQMIRDQAAPIAPDFARAQQACSPAWTARLARPRPLARQRAELMRWAETCAANGWADQAAAALREAWPTATADECAAAAAELVRRARGARAAAELRRELDRQRRRRSNRARLRRRSSWCSEC